jgi:hypothetical protein
VRQFGLSGAAVNTSSSSSSSGSRVEAQNFATLDYVQDHAVLFTCTGGVATGRIDVTLVPRVTRPAAASPRAPRGQGQAAMVCQPSPAAEALLPRSVGRTEARHTHQSSRLPAFLLCGQAPGVCQRGGRAGGPGRGVRRTVPRRGAVGRHARPEGGWGGGTEEY